MIQKKENICNPSVGILSSLALSNTMGVNLRDSIKALDRPLIQELVKNSSEFRMLGSDLLSNEFNLEESKFKLIFWNPIGFINAIDELSNILLLNNHNSKKNIASGTEYAKSEELEKMLRFYVKEYLNGKFVLRDGTRLSKPDGKITHERAKVEVDDKTVEKSFFVTSFEVSAITGLTTVLLEAFFDHCLKTPIYANEKHKAIYEPVYEKTNKDSNKFNLFYEETKIDDHFFSEENYNIPTVAKFYIVESEEIDYIVRKDRSEITNEEKERIKNIQAIRRISNFSAVTTKAAVGATFKSLGGLGASFGGFFKFSLGDNEAINQIVETAASVAARRKTENILYSLLDNGQFYKCGTAENETSCLTKVQDLLKIWNDD